MENEGHDYQIQGYIMSVDQSTTCACWTKGFLVDTLLGIGIVTDMVFRFPRSFVVILVKPFLWRKAHEQDSA